MHMPAPEYDLLIEKWWLMPWFVSLCYQHWIDVCKSYSRLDRLIIMSVVRCLVTWGWSWDYTQDCFTFAWKFATNRLINSWVGLRAQQAFLWYCHCWIQGTTGEDIWRSLQNLVIRVDTCITKYLVFWSSFGQGIWSSSTVNWKVEIF